MIYDIRKINCFLLRTVPKLIYIYIYTHNLITSVNIENFASCPFQKDIIKTIWAHN